MTSFIRINIDSCFFRFWYCVAIALFETFLNRRGNLHCVINNAALFAQKNILIPYPGNRIYHLYVLQHGQLRVLVWVIWESMQGLSAPVLAVFDSFVFDSLNNVSDSYVRFLLLLKHHWKGHNTAILLHLLTLHIFPEVLPWHWHGIDSRQNDIFQMLGI